MRARSAGFFLLAGAGLCALCLGQAGPSAPAGPAATQPAPAAPAGTYPKPMLVPLQWQFDIDLDPLRPITFRRPGSDKPQLYWYLRYTVTNNSDTDQVFVPEFALYTDTGQLLRAGQQTPTAVFFKIKKLLNDPLLKQETSLTRKLLRGRDNAQTGVAIWPDFDPNAGAVDIFIGGLSGETVVIDLPEPVQTVETNWRGVSRTVTRNKLILAKTLHLRYLIPGEKAARWRARPRLVRREWVMR
ncbi:MAG: hypothetical protein J7M21_01930 [Planctomycetes bacterium]|nr:hypothetical protein [Planctomycetota bacterium]